HRSASLSPPDTLMPGTKVIFLYSGGQNGKPAARSVRILSLIPDVELVAVLRDSEVFPPQDMLTVLLSRNMLSPCESDALQAVIALTATASAPEILTQFWEKFPPVSPKDLLYPHAPNNLKIKVCKQYYSEF